jgi:Arc/MetJ-type ribon-helix-helix transcriptional regulator
MPGQRRNGITNVSFTMPEKMAEALDQRARAEMTNKSELVRRAVLAFLSPSEVDAIRRSVMMNEDTKPEPMPPQKPVKYEVMKGKK